jgi:serine/threonine-protein kinase
MSPENWHLVDRLYAEALEKPPEEREQFLSAACAGGPPEIRAKVEELLRSPQEDDPPLPNDWRAWFRRVLQSEPTTIDDLAPVVDGPPAQTGEPLTAPRGYEVLCELSRGGQGIVYLARQLNPARLVALKFIHKDRLGSLPPEEHSRWLERFRADANLLARVRHANMVQVFEGGEHDGLPFFSMEYCGGGSLKEKLRDGPLPPRKAAELLLTLAQAVDAIHREGMIHCDLSPANVLLAEDDTPKVTDLGIAKIRDDQELTPPGAVLGKAPYMAPEQARGRREEVGPGTDVYALGVILYECLTGRPPFQAASSAETIHQALTREPVPPRQLNRSIDRGLQFICLKCLEKRPEHRYPSADALAADLRRYLAGESPEPLPWWEWLWRRVQSGGSFEPELAARWGGLAFLTAGYSLLGHGLMYGLLRLGPPAFVYWLWFLVFHLADWLIPLRTLDLRERRLDPVERGLLLNWGAVVIADTLLFALFCPPFRIVRPETVVGVYPAWMTVHGLMWFMEARQYWGRFYVVGAVFFLTAALMPLRLDLAPLVLGAVNAAGLVWLGVELRCIARRPAGLAERRQPAGGGTARGGKVHTSGGRSDDRGE